MFQPRLYPLTASLIVVLLVVTSAHSQARSTPPDTFAKHHQELLAQNPEAFEFTLKLKDNKKQFHLGEVIRLELGFASTLPDAYVIDTAGYDRSGRLDIDQFVVDRADEVVDPLHDYYWSGLFGFMGGGLRGSLAVEKKPQVINCDLNEWARFAKPGKYRLYVVSSRITKGKPYHSGNEAVSAASNLIEFEILPANANWEQQALKDALQLLDSRAPANTRSQEDARHSGCRALRFLGTEEAIKESVTRFRGQDQNCDFEYDFGLLGTPRRAFAVAQMEAAIAAPDQPITTGFLNTLAFLAYLVETPEQLPPYPVNNVAEQKVWQLQMAERRRSYDVIVEREVSRLAIAVRQKEHTAAAISLETLIDFQTRPNSATAEAQRKELATSLAKVFFDLPRETQQSLIEYRWQQIADPVMLPVLRQLYEHPPDMNVSPAPFPGLALQRIYELAPEEGRQLIFEEMRRPQFRVGARILGALPDKDLPQLEDTIIERAIDPKDGFNQQETALALVNRYASTAALPRVRAAFEDRMGNIACLSQESLLAYFLRSDQAFGLQMLRKALLSRKQSHCYATALKVALHTKLSAEAEQLVLEALDDRDEEVMEQAADVLGHYGNVADKEKVRARIKQQLEEWRDQKRDPDSAVSQTNIVHLGSFTEMLLNRYAHAVAWFIDKEELQELAGLCPNKQCRDQVKGWSESWGSEIVFQNTLSEDSPPQFSVGHYNGLSLADLKLKLAQYPKKTTFTWNPERKALGKEEQLFAELRDYLAAQEMKLVRLEDPKN